MNHHPMAERETAIAELLREIELEIARLQSIIDKSESYTSTGQRQPPPADAC